MAGYGHDPWTAILTIGGNFKIHGYHPIFCIMNVWYSSWTLIMLSSVWHQFYDSILIFLPNSFQNIKIAMNLTMLCCVEWCHFARPRNRNKTRIVDYWLFPWSQPLIKSIGVTWTNNRETIRNVYIWWLTHILVLNMTISSNIKYSVSFSMIISINISTIECLQ